MLKLHGFSYSNYYNIVKHTLLVKKIPFEEDMAFPQSAALLAVTPTGKAPAMTTENGTHLSESSVLVDYLEDKYPNTPLYPTNAEARAVVRQIMKVSELYLELPARRLLPSAMAKLPVPDAVLAEVRATLDRGVTGLTKLATFGPYVAGAELTVADIYLRYAMAIPKMVGPAILDWDIVKAIPGLSEWDEMMAQSDISKKVDAGLVENTAAFIEYVSGGSKK
jgi:glutathione S-transferase